MGGGSAVKQSDDARTLELPGLVAKRGRGRPRKPDALTPAQRAKHYRDRLRQARQHPYPALYRAGAFKRRHGL